jgi:hypothetical protein
MATQTEEKNVGYKWEKPSTNFSTSPYTVSNDYRQMIDLDNLSSAPSERLYHVISPVFATTVFQAINLIVSSFILGISIAMLIVSTMVNAVMNITPWQFWLIPMFGAISITGGTLINILCAKKRMAGK